MKGGWPRHRPLPNALSHSRFVCMDQIEEGAWQGGLEETARVLSTKSKSLCASYSFPVCGPRKLGFEGIVSMEGGKRGGHQDFLQKLLEALQM